MDSSDTDLDDLKQDRRGISTSPPSFRRFGASSTPQRARRRPSSKSSSPEQRARRDFSLRTSDTESLGDQEEENQNPRYKLSRGSLNRLSASDKTPTSQSKVSKRVSQAPSITSSSTLVDHESGIEGNYKGYRTLKSPEPQLKTVSEVPTTSIESYRLSAADYISSVPARASIEPAMDSSYPLRSSGSVRIHKAFDRILRASQSPPTASLEAEVQPTPSTSKRISPRFTQSEWQATPHGKARAEDHTDRDARSPPNEYYADEEDQDEPEQPHYMNAAKQPRTPSRSFASTYRNLDLSSYPTPVAPGHYRSQSREHRFSRLRGSTFEAERSLVGEQEEEWQAERMQEREDILSVSLDKVKGEELGKDQERDSRVSVLSDEKLPLPPKEEDQIDRKPSLKKRLSNKKSSTDAERAALPDEGLELQRQGVDRETSNTLLQAIMEAQKLDSSLKERAIEVQRTVEEIGARVGARISEAVDTTLQVETRRRNRWLFWAIGAEIALVCFLYKLASAHARHQYLTSYYDPFYPTLHEYASYSSPRNFALPAQAISASWNLQIANTWQDVVQRTFDSVVNRWSGILMDGDQSWVVPT